MKRWMRFPGLAAVAFLGSTACAEVPKTPETSSLFQAHRDPGSGVVSYVLRPEVGGFNRQSWYFTNKSMTDDGRFLLFDAIPDERESPPDSPSRRVKTLIDFGKDEIVALPPMDGKREYLDVRSDALYFSRSSGFFRIDLAVDPRHCIPLCAMPEFFRRPGEKVYYYYTHLTVSRDGRKAFLDSALDGIGGKRRYFQGTVDLATGQYEPWGETPFYCNHGQLNPADANVALVAWEDCQPFARSGEPYPRMWLVRRDGSRRILAPKANAHATHEGWMDDGRCVYYCSNATAKGGRSGVFVQDVVTGREKLVSPQRATHATVSSDGSLVAYDLRLPPGHRGSRFRVGFWNARTARGVMIHTELPEYASPERPSRLHPDPHPQFVSHDRYVVCTMFGADHRLNLSVTPVAELLKQTSATER